MSTDYSSDNNSQRHRLIQLVARLSDADLAHPMPGGWTVATKLAHLAYWDQYALARLKTAQRSGFQVVSLSTQFDEINAAVRTLSEAIPPRAAAELAVAAAEAVDRLLETISPELRQSIAANGSDRLLNRSLHRREHLDQIEQAMQAKV
jgi:uncharacterized damage-inducible protein DinB